MTWKSSSPDLWEAISTNMISFWSSYGRAKGAKVERTPNWAWFYTGIRSPLFNGVLRVQFEPAEVKALIDKLRIRIKAQGAPALWWLDPQSNPDPLGRLLEQIGLAPAGEVPAMAIELDGIGKDSDRIADFTVQRVDRPDLQAVWGRTAGAGTGLPDEAIDRLAELEEGLSDEPYLAQRRYIGMLAGVPVATSAMVLDGGVAGIYAVATLPAARRRGIGRLMTIRPLEEAREMGCRVGILQASSAGYSLYKKIGFQDFGRYHLYLQT
jgi:GNAT superfamily N-acetyltransferase